MSIDLQSVQVTPLHDCSEERKAEVLQWLQQVGADQYDLLLPESRCLPKLLNPDEQLRGVVYGKYTLGHPKYVGRGLLAVTDRRVLLIDKKPLFTQFNDIAFSVLSGVSYGHAGITETVVLNTRLGDIHVRTFNAKCASNFVRVVEDVLFNNRKERPL